MDFKYNMDFTSNKWVSLEFQSEEFSSIISTLVRDFYIASDFIVFDSIFPNEEFFSKLKLIKASSPKFNSVFYIESERYYTTLSLDIIGLLFQNNLEYWTSHGLENISLFRDTSCYLETIFHDCSLFVSSHNKNEISKLGIQNEIFDVLE